jgi:ribosomal protein S18 acetylase RimI-like enzyme
MAVIFRCVQCGRSLGWQDAVPVPSCKAHGSRPELDVQRLDKANDRVLALIINYFGGAEQTVWGESYDAAESPAIVALEGGYIVGALSYALDPDALTVIGVAVDPQYQGSGAGGKLYRELEQVAIENKLPAIRAATSNDNPLSIYFHQRAGFVIDSIHPIDAQSVDPANRTGMGGIPLTHEIRLVRSL